MTSPAPERTPAESAGNALAVLVLGITGLLFIRVTEGPWWVAAPGAERWQIAAAVVVFYALFCLWFWRRGR